MLPGKDHLISYLRQLDAQLAPTHHAEIIVRRDDEFDWTSLKDCTRCDLPGHQHGQHRDIRYETDREDGLHARVFPDHVAFHLDLANACRDVVAHTVKDTNAIPIAILGSVLGYFVAGSRGAVLGGLAGAAVGSQTPSRSARTYALREVIVTQRRPRLYT